MRVIVDEATSSSGDDMMPEYRLDYSKAKPNRFAEEDLILSAPCDVDTGEVSSRRWFRQRRLNAKVTLLMSRQVEASFDSIDDATARLILQNPELLETQIRRSRAEAPKGISILCSPIPEPASKESLEQDPVHPQEFRVEVDNRRLGFYRKDFGRPLGELSEENLRDFLEKDVGLDLHALGWPRRDAV